MDSFHLNLLALVPALLALLGVCAIALNLIHASGGRWRLPPAPLVVISIAVLGITFFLTVRIWLQMTAHASIAANILVIAGVTVVALALYFLAYRAARKGADKR